MQDTIWAKRRMAEHLMQKYKLTRVDSFYYNDIYTYSLHPDSIHLLKTHTDPKIIMSIYNIGWDQHCQGCTLANSLGWIFEDQGYSRYGLYRYELIADRTFIDQKFLNNSLFHFEYNYKKYRELDASELATNLRDDFGILLTHEARDTVKMGYYNYSE